ncbi:MAG: Maf family protein [Pseudomonadota bacterium]
MGDSQFVLASRSPRRVQFLREAGFAFSTDPADVPECPAPNEPARDYALRVARAKAGAALQRQPLWPALGADTDVVLDGRILGKPGDAADAHAMLTALSGRSHQVISAVVLLHGSRCESVTTVTEIDFAPLSESDIAAYVASGEPMGKAGAYAIQGLAARFVRAVRGSYTGVVGLPMAETCDLLLRFGISPSATAQ